MFAGFLFETAAVWSSNIHSAMYQFIKDEMIANIQHRQQLAREIEAELNGEGLQESELSWERQQLQKLLNFALSAPIEVTLSYAVVSEDGYYVRCETRSFILK